MFWKKKWNDAMIIEAFRNAGTEADQALYYLMGENSQKIASLAKKYGGSEEEAAALLHDGLTQLWWNIVNDAFRLESSIATYLYAICRNLWRNTLRQKGKHNYLELVESSNEPDFADTGTPETLLLKDEQRNVLAEVLRETSEKCVQLLTMYSQGFSMKEIADALGYKNPEVASSKKDQCREALLRKIDGMPGLQQLITEMGWKTYRRK